jgi:RNA polymerase sigma-70 factor (ECF subfamily)
MGLSSRSRDSSDWPTPTTFAIQVGTREALVSHTSGARNETRSGVEFEDLVRTHYESLYRFALSLTRSEADAGDLTQQTFLIWCSKGHQLRDRSRAKTWLFTTLHREFLRLRRRQVRFPQVELTEGEAELSFVEPEGIEILKLDSVLCALARVEPLYQTTLSLFYLEDMSYREMADILGVPVGTVQSRLSRGKAQLRQLLGKESVSPAKDLR